MGLALITLSSFVRINVIRVVRDENNGAKNTQTFLMSMVMLKKCNTLYSAADVTIKPTKTLIYICYPIVTSTTINASM